MMVHAIATHVSRIVAGAGAKEVPGMGKSVLTRDVIDMESQLRESIASQVIAIQKSQGISAMGLATKAKTSTASITAVRGGGYEGSSISLITLCKVVDALGCKISVKIEPVEADNE